MKYSSRLLIAILALSAIPLVLLTQLPSSEAADNSIKIVLPAVSDRSGYNLPKLNDALLNRLRSQFMSPKYETILVPALTVPPVKAELERITNEKAADGAVVLEINAALHQIHHGLFNDEDYSLSTHYEETYIEMTLSYFDKKTGQYDQLKLNRSFTRITNIHSDALSGVLPLALDMLEETLNKLDMIFPRRVSGHSY